MALINKTDIQESLKGIAAEYPQYVGYADGWVEATATKDVKTKGGLVMLAGDTVVVNPLSESIGGRYGKPRPFVTVWSARRHGAVSVDKRHIAFK